MKVSQKIFVKHNRAKSKKNMMRNSKNKKQITCLRKKKDATQSRTDASTTFMRLSTFSKTKQI